MGLRLATFVLVCSLGGNALAKLPAPLVTGLRTPESVAIGTDGQIYVTEIGEFGKDGDGAVVVIKQGKAEPFATGLNDPKGIVAYQNWLFVADKDLVWRIDREGKAAPFAPRNAFPRTPQFLNDIAVDPESGTLYVSDSGDLKGAGGVVFRVSAKGLVDVLADEQRWPGLKTPNGLLMDGASHLLMIDFTSGELHRIKLADGSHEKLADGFGGSDGLAWDHHGRLFASDWKGGRVFGMARPGSKPVLISDEFKAAADLCVDPIGKRLLVPDMTAGTLTALPLVVPGDEVDETPLELGIAPAFADLKWTNWKGADDPSKPVPLRPIVLTHANDGSGRTFVATQQGVLHSFRADSKETTVLMDIQDRVRYLDNQNEEGLLGMAFSPQFKTNGEFYLFYTLKNAKHPLTNVVSRFKAGKGGAPKADPASEEELFRFERPFWNHDGGTLAFGPDGMLYIAVGDGGAANDPHDNGQNLKNLFGKVLRIDVSKREGDKPYAIPKDNPFVDNKEARPEIWCYGLRNVWRFAFDAKTGDCWAGDVGQNLYEEINLLTKGGNFGWNLREGLHPFGARGVGVRKDLVDPIWEYHHDLGKSITGGLVYRGKKIPQLAGMYVYADYVTNRVWALQYDADKRRVVANRPITGKCPPVLSFGEDEQGEAYLLVASPTGRGVLQFVPAAKPAGATSDKPTTIPTGTKPKDKPKKKASP